MNNGEKTSMHQVSSVPSQSSSCLDYLQYVFFVQPVITNNSPCIFKQKRIMQTDTRMERKINRKWKQKLHHPSSKRFVENCNLIAREPWKIAKLLIYIVRKAHEAFFSNVMFMKHHADSFPAIYYSY